MLIIATFLLSLNACGYKAPPYYMEKAPQEDENVKFILEEKKVNIENNESCSD
jgi:predicted small lipoprotein YifL